MTNIVQLHSVFSERTETDLAIERNSTLIFHFSLSQGERVTYDLVFFHELSKPMKLHSLLYRQGSHINLIMNFHDFSMTFPWQYVTFPWLLIINLTFSWPRLFSFFNKNNYLQKYTTKKFQFFKYAIIPFFATL